MGLPISNTKINQIAGSEVYHNGGKGSGNFGHAGRLGKIGGSASGTETTSTKTMETTYAKKAKKAWDEVKRVKLELDALRAEDTGIAIELGLATDEADKKRLEGESRRIRDKMLNLDEKLSKLESIVQEALMKDDDYAASFLGGYDDIRGL